MTPALYKNLDYDPVKDFAPVAAVATDAQVMVVNPAVPVHTLAELVQYAKDHPGKLSSGASIGIAPHLLLEYFRVRTGTDIVFVPYKGAAPAIADLLGNQIQINVTTKAILLPHIKAGRLRALAVDDRALAGVFPMCRRSAKAIMTAFRYCCGWACSRRPGRLPPDRQDQCRGKCPSQVARDAGRSGQSRLDAQPPARKSSGP